MILTLKGRASGDQVWCDVLAEIGRSWQTGALSDDEAKDLETMARTFRFPKK